MKNTSFCKHIRLVPVIVVLFSFFAFLQSALAFDQTLLDSVKAMGAGNADARQQAIHGQVFHK